MFISCPHCRELVAIDRETRLAPEMCPRCGGVLRDPPKTEAPALDSSAADGRSFVSFLQNDETPTAVPGTEATPTAEAGIVKDEIAGPASLEDDSGEPAAIGTGTTAISEASPGVGPRAIDGAGSDVAATSTTSAPAAAPIAQSLQALPSFTRQVLRPGTHPRTARWQWAMLIVLSLLLALQVLLADRARLAADATWRPLVVRLCGALGCSIPPWHQPSAFAMLSRDVSPIAGSAAGLNVQATFRNDARWAQDWPVLLLSLSDADGRVLGSRAFTPREYLGTAAAQAELAPGQSAQIALQLHEPNPNVVAFTFDFR